LAAVPDHGSVIWNRIDDYQVSRKASIDLLSHSLTIIAAILATA
jgi:hypothetical protein